jgi:non-ribosomal peptide synthetase component F
MASQLVDPLSAYRSIPDVVHAQARARPSKPALLHARGSLAYAELDERCRRFAAFVAAHAGRAARVGVLLPNVPEFAISYLGAIAAGAVARDDVTELGAVLAGAAPGRPDGDAVTLFDSTGLAIQDLAIAIAAYEAWRDGRVRAQEVRL